MSETNEQTLDSYNNYLQEYIDGTPHEVSGGQKIWIDTALAKLPSNARILEIGSGFGRDADYMESKGFAVARTDAAQSFVGYMNQNGKNTELLNVITDEIEGSFDMIFANAVLLHLTPEELNATLGKIRLALRREGILTFTMKRGSGSEWSEAKIGAPRFFQYWEQKPLIQILEESGFIISWSSAKTDEKWLHIIAKPTLD